MRWALVAVFCVLATAAQAADPRPPAPRPPGWPSDFCTAEGANAANPLCGTCSTMALYSYPTVGIALQWACKVDGKWITYGFTKPPKTRFFVPSQADVISKGIFGAFWDANVVAATAEEEAAGKSLVEANLYGLTQVYRPPDPPPPPAVSWIVSPVSTGLRPSYLLVDGVSSRETGKFIPTATASKPTPCDCAGASSPQLCPVPTYITATGQQRYASCVKAP